MDDVGIAEKVVARVLAVVHPLSSEEVDLAVGTHDAASAPGGDVLEGRVSVRRIYSCSVSRKEVEPSAIGPSPDRIAVTESVDALSAEIAIRNRTTSAATLAAATVIHIT
eukprot:CAMPEP_0197541204 /NCGR_PEP_ID=MMETSP1318-20131121/67030_1 /TAXON_ID=552666 /ORGANISM="Partenskyella glossopodia, Strain RCC365" /LENGTH=109 /DNA_ID=CAMNT_0043100353 /DNA_START=1410 /DNA_END=1739 /DNA_ORIENTATION=-